MADVARELLVTLGIKFDNKSAQRAEQKVEQLKHAAEGLARSFKNLDRGNSGGIAKLAGSLDYAAKPAASFADKLGSVKTGIQGLVAAFAVRKIAQFIQSTADAADELKAQAERIGTTTQALQGLQFAAQMSDTSAEALGSGLQFLARSAYAAANGSKESHEAFAKLGVSVKDANGKLKTTDQLMLEVADGLGKISSPAEKTALTMKVMGRSAGELVPFLSKGSAEILGFRQELEDLGGVFSTDFVNVADDWNDNGTRMGAVMKGIGAAMAGGVLPPLNRMVTRFMATWKIFGGIIRSGIEKFFAGIGVVLETIGAVLEAVILPAFAAIAYKIAEFGELDAGLQIILVTVGAIALAMSGILAPWMLIGALIALVAEDLYTFFVGGDSVTGDIVNEFIELGNNIKEIFGSAVDWIVEKFQGLASKLSSPLQALKGFFGGDVAQSVSAETIATVGPTAPGGSVVNAPTTTNTITVTPGPGMDEEALADKVMRKLDEHEAERNREAFGALVPSTM